MRKKGLLAAWIGQAYNIFLERLFNILKQSIMDDIICDHLEMGTPSRFITVPISRISSLDEKLLVETVASKQKKNPMVQTCDSFKPRHKKQSSMKIARPRYTEGNLQKMALKSLKPQKINQVKKKVSRKEVMLSTMSRLELKFKVEESENQIKKKKNQSIKKSVQQLQARSIEINDELSLLKSQRSCCQRVNKSRSRTNRLAQTSIKTSFAPQVYGESPDFLISAGETAFKQIDNFINLEAEDNMKKSTKKGFYDKLKDKLNLQIEKITQKKKSVQEPIILDCRSKERPTEDMKQTFRAPLTERSRPRTAMTRTGLQTSRDPIIAGRKRPMSSQSKILEKKELSYKSEQIREQTQRDLERMKIDTPKKKVKKSTFQPELSLNLKHIVPMHKRRNWSPSKSELQKQKIKQKMLNLLIKCHDTSKQSNLEEGLKIFDRYCKKLGSNMEKTCRMIDHVQRTSTINEDEDFL